MARDFFCFYFSSVFPIKVPGGHSLSSRGKSPALNDNPDQCHFISQYTLDPGLVNLYCCNPVFLFIVFGENKTELNWTEVVGFFNLTLANSLKVSIISFVATSLCMGAPQFFIHASSTLEWQTNMRRWSNHNNNAGNFICNKQCLSTEEFEPSFSKQ